LRRTERQSPARTENLDQAPARVALPADPGTQAHQTRHARFRVHAAAHAGVEAPHAHVRLQHDEAAGEIVTSLQYMWEWHPSSCGWVPFCAVAGVRRFVRAAGRCLAYTERFRRCDSGVSRTRNDFVDVIRAYRVHGMIS